MKNKNFFDYVHRKPFKLSLPKSIDEYIIHEQLKKNWSFKQNF